MDRRRTITCRAHAKLNLALAVGPPVPPAQPNAGYHPICSWMHAVDLFDVITIERLGDGAISKHDLRWADGSPVAWHTDDDLCVRAHRALEARSERNLPVRISVTKHIPAGGGLGGGSSDAASVLLALNDLFAIGFDQHRLRQTALPLGSDIPFFIDAASWAIGSPPRPALVEGFGETIENLTRRDDRVILICPPFGCSTPDVYHAFDTGATPLDAKRVRSAAAGPPQSANLFNDLARPATDTQPQLRSVINRLAGHCDAPVHVSGSGSTLFILQSDPNSPEKHTQKNTLASQARIALPECRVLETRLV